jgi:hypothetical protein
MAVRVFHAWTGSSPAIPGVLTFNSQLIAHLLKSLLEFITG